MGELFIKTDVFAPEREYIAEYRNVHRPTVLMSMMLQLGKDTWRLPSSATFTDHLKWDVSGDPAEWYGEWRFRDKRDRFTTIWNRVICQGTYDKKTKMGSVTVKVKPSIEVRFEWSNQILGAFFYFWFKAHYEKMIPQFIEHAKVRVADFDTEIRETFGMRPREYSRWPSGKKREVS